MALQAAKGGAEVAKESGRVFWSGAGNESVELAARKFATENGFSTLEMTHAGENLTKLTKNMSYAEKLPYWERLSTHFAKGAEGTVHVFQNAENIGLKSVWGRIEYPILNLNSNVRIIYHLIP